MADFSDILLTTDFDRTLTAPDATVPTQNVEAIRYFIENGGSFTVNTGRSIPMSMRNILGVIPTNVPLLLYNGSAAYDAETGRLSSCIPIALDPAEVLSQLQEKFPTLNVELQAPDAHYLMKKNPKWEAYCTHNGGPWKYGAPDQLPKPFLKFAIYSEFLDANVSSLYKEIPEDRKVFLEAARYIEEHYGDKVDVFLSCARLMDIHAKGVSKLASARRLQKELGKRLLVCVGDAENDLPMLEGADYAFCPSDGTIADRFPNVCPCAEGAVADVIYNELPKLLG